MGKTIMATDLYLSYKTPIHSIMNFYKEMKSWGGNIYLIQNRRMVDCSHLAKLITFILTAQPSTPVKMVLEGQNPEEMEHRFSKILTYQTYAQGNATVFK
ncbi:MAG: hypothetical protein ACI4XL_07880 [Bacillus sp. (in: firmicutes)]